MKSYKLNVQSIRQTWQTCEKSYIVHVKEEEFITFEGVAYIKSVLSSWFGSCEFFFYDHGVYSFLCGDK